MKTTIATIRTVAVLSWLLVAASVKPAAAQKLEDVGGRIGVSGDPTQFYLGPHFDIGPFVPQLWFRPNLELGFGDGGQLLAFNFEFQYRVKMTGSLRNAPWQPYIAAGPAFLYAHSSGGGSGTGGGFNIGFGLQHSKGLFGEMKFGVADSPTFKLGIGYSWKQ